MEKGIKWFLLSRVSFSLVCAIVKYFPYASVQFNFMRGVFISLYLVPKLWFKNGVKAFRSSRPILMTVRVILALIGLVCYYYTFQKMTFAKAVTLGSSYTFFTPLFAKIFLKEEIGIQRVMAMSIAYAGVWIALDPLYSGIDFFEIVALINVLLTAIVNTMSKALVSKDPPELLMAYTSILTVVCIGLAWILFDVWAPSFGVKPWPAIPLFTFIGLTLLVGLLGYLAQFSYLKSFTYADLSLLMPFEYSGFVMSILLGYLVFGEVPVFTTWVGMVLIMSAIGVLTSYELHAAKKRRRRRARQA